MKALDPESGGGGYPIFTWISCAAAWQWAPIWEWAPGVCRRFWSCRWTAPGSQLSETRCVLYTEKEDWYVFPSNGITFTQLSRFSGTHRSPENLKGYLWWNPHHMMKVRYTEEGKEEIHVVWIIDNLMRISILNENPECKKVDPNSAKSDLTSTLYMYNILFELNSGTFCLNRQTDKDSPKKIYCHFE